MYRDDKLIIANLGAMQFAQAPSKKLFRYNRPHGDLSRLDRSQLSAAHLPFQCGSTSCAGTRAGLSAGSAKTKQDHPGKHYQESAWLRNVAAPRQRAETTYDAEPSQRALLKGRSRVKVPPRINREELIPEASTTPPAASEISCLGR